VLIIHRCDNIKMKVSANDSILNDMYCKIAVCHATMLIDNLQESLNKNRFTRIEDWLRMLIWATVALIWLVNKFYDNIHMNISNAQRTTPKQTKSRIFPLESWSLSRHGFEETESCAKSFEETESCAKGFEDGWYFPVTLSSNIPASSNHMQAKQSNCRDLSMLKQRGWSSPSYSGLWELTSRGKLKINCY